MTFCHRKGRRRSKFGRGCRNFQGIVASILKTVRISKIITQIPNTKAITISKSKAIIKDHLVKGIIIATLTTKMKNHRE